jgi:hypothetical protein
MEFGAKLTRNPLSVPRNWAALRSLIESAMVSSDAEMKLERKADDQRERIREQVVVRAWFTSSRATTIASIATSGAR